MNFDDSRKKHPPVTKMVPNTTVPNVSMGLIGEHKPNYRPRDIRGINATRIVVEKRMRPLNYAWVETLARGFLTEGQLQPIGVKQIKGEYKYRLIYGDHRRAAAVSLEQSGRGTSEIAAVIFPEDMPDWRCELAEIAENLMRHDLSDQEKQAHTALYAGLLKKHGLTSKADDLRSENAKPRGKDMKLEGQPKPSVDHPKPSVTKAVAMESGIDVDTVRYRIKKAAAVAEAAGVEVPKGATPEDLPADKLIEIGKAAAAAPKQTRQRAQKVVPLEPKEKSEPEPKVTTESVPKVADTAQQCVKHLIDAFAQEEKAEAALVAAERATVDAVQMAFASGLNPETLIEALQEQGYEVGYDQPLEFRKLYRGKGAWAKAQAAR